MSKQNQKPDTGESEKSNELDDVVIKVATLEGQVKTLLTIDKIFAFVALVIGLGVSGLGVYKASDLQSQVNDSKSEMAQTKRDMDDAVEKANTRIDEARVILDASADLVKQADIERIEALLIRPESFDAFRAAPGLLQQLITCRDQLAQVNLKVSTAKQCSYVFVVDALEAYVEEDYTKALACVSQVNEPEAGRYGYLALKAACLLRNGRPAEAEICLRKAANLPETSPFCRARANIGRAYSLAECWKLSNKEADLERAIELLKTVTSEYYELPTGHFNLACTLALRSPVKDKDYRLIAYHLGYPVEIGAWTMADLLRYIKEDLDRPTDNYLATYVKSHLNVRLSTGSREWEDTMAGALEREFEEARQQAQPE